MGILITICARGGSKGIPGKNIKEIGGQPLIAYTINIAKKVRDIFDGKIALSTDSEEIRLTAKEWGLVSSYIRPDELATDSAGKIDTIRDLLLYEEAKSDKKFEFILDLDVTSPLRTLEDLKSAFENLKSSDALNIFSVNDAARSPYFNMVEKKENGFYDLIKKNDNGTVMSRQSAPVVYDMNASFYWYRRSFFDQNIKSAITERSLIFRMDHICFDLDHPIDFDFLDYLIVGKKIQFDFQ